MDTIGRTKLVEIGSKNTTVVLGMDGALRMVSTTTRCGAQADMVNRSVLHNRIFGSNGRDNPTYLHKFGFTNSVHKMTGANFPTNTDPLDPNDTDATLLPTYKHGDSF